jgi:GT2 family glycosyltransferase
VPSVLCPPTAPAIDVSVCIVNWCCTALLRGCLRSLLRSPQGVQAEVIVVDNASPDGAADMVAREFPKAELIRNTANLGFARGNNQAADQATGKYLFFLNNDTIVPPHTLGRLLAFAEAHPDVGLVGPRLRDSEGFPQVSYRSLPTLATLLHRTLLVRASGLLRTSYRRHRREEFDPETTRQVPMLLGAAVLMRRDRFFAWGRWDEEFPFGGEDLELCARVGRRAPLVYFPEAEITHFGRASTRVNKGPAATKIAFGFARYLRKTGTSRLGVFLYKTAVTLDAPLQILCKGMEYFYRRLRGQREKAAKSLLVVQTASHLLCKGLLSFWKA